MSVAWAARRAACGHRRCTAGGWITAAAVPCLIAGFTWLVAAPSARAAAMFGAAVITFAAATGTGCRATWTGDDDAEAATLDGILADPPLPKRWTRAHWADLEQELSR